MVRNKQTVPFTLPYWGPEEAGAAADALSTTAGTGDGPYTVKLEQQLVKLTGAPFVHAVSSCTHGLELAVRVLGLKPGEEVIVPSFTLSATANAVIAAGGIPVFADIDPATYGMDPADAEKLVTRKTRGIIVVHYAGMPCQIDKIRALAKRHNLFLIEDAAHCIGAAYNGQALGTFGDIGVYSFHGTKNACCGEGGAVVTANEGLFEDMDAYRSNGTNRRQFLKGQVDKYTWVGLGSSYFLSDILAAVMTVQIPKVPEINRRRTAVAAAYTRAFSDYVDILTLPRVPEGARPNWHIYAVRFRRAAHALSFLSGMREAGIGVTTHYVPLHSSPYGRHIAGKRFRRLPVTENVAETLIRIPMYPGLTDDQIAYITATARSLLDGFRGTR